MVPRYSRPDMVAIWTPEARFQIWFEIEAHATDALADLGAPRGHRRDLGLVEALGDLAMAIKPHFTEQFARERVAAALHTLVDHIIEAAKEPPHAD